MEQQIAQLRALINSYERQIIDLANPVLEGKTIPTKDWAFAHLDDALFSVAGYLLFVFVGTVFMKTVFPVKGPAKKEREENVPLAVKFSKEPILFLQVLYNPVQVILCGYMMYEAIRIYIKEGYQPICNAFNVESTSMASIVHVFYLSKILDFLDTFFIIVRRKWEQLSFLHVYHHSSIFMFYWLNINAGYDGDVYFTVILNSFIHLLMYFYYECRTLNIPVPMAIKQCVTHSQRIQFVCMNVQAIYLLVNGCPYPPRITAGYLIYIISLFILFTNFDAKTYRKDKKAGKEAGKKSN